MTGNPNAIMTDDETRQFEDSLAEREQIEVELERINGLPSPSRSYDRFVRVGQEERTYRPDLRRTGEPSFFRDLALSQVFRDPGQPTAWRTISVK